METTIARIPLIALVASSLFCLLARPVIGCSGPLAGELIERNGSIVNVYGFAAILLFLATVVIYFVRRRTGIPAIVLSLVVGFFHPFWHYGGGGGDCGGSFVELAKYVTILLAVFLLIQVALWRFRLINQNKGGSTDEV